MPDRYSKIDEASALGFFANALFDGGQDRGAMFPRTDAEDMSRGARFIPGDVTLARRRGEKVDFTSDCGPCCWYWTLPDGTRIYHFDPLTYEDIGRQNNGAEWTREAGLAGRCPRCNNEHTSGGRVSKTDV